MVQIKNAMLMCLAVGKRPPPDAAVLRPIAWKRVVLRLNKQNGQIKMTLPAKSVVTVFANKATLGLTSLMTVGQSRQSLVAPNSIVRSLPTSRAFTQSRSDFPAKFSSFGRDVPTEFANLKFSLHKGPGIPATIGFASDLGVIH